MSKTYIRFSIDDIFEMIENTLENEGKKVVAITPEGALICVRTEDDCIFEAEIEE